MATVEDDDALYVLTAVLLTPAQFPSVLGDDYPEVCAALGLEPYAEGYGLVLGQDGEGARWTVATDDVTLVACAIAAWDCGMEYDLSPDERTVAAVLPGWPLALAVSAPGVPAPHDPEPEAEPAAESVAEAAPSGARRGPAVLTPPETDGWGPTQRRLGADEIALQWAAWREQVEDGVRFAAEEQGPADERIQRVLGELRTYVETPPPPGRVRSAFASDGARTIRADGPGWSLVARTDDIAFLLLDEEPGEILPIGQGARLPALLEALDGVAVRPAA